MLPLPWTLDSLWGERDLIYKKYILSSPESLLFFLLKGHTGLLEFQGEVGAESLNLMNVPGAGEDSGSRAPG